MRKNVLIYVLKFIIKEYSFWDLSNLYNQIKLFRKCRWNTQLRNKRPKPSSMVVKLLRNLLVVLKSLAMPRMFQKADNKEILPCMMSDSKEKIWDNSSQDFTCKAIWRLMMSLIWKKSSMPMTQLEWVFYFQMIWSFCSPRMASTPTKKLSMKSLPNLMLKKLEDSVLFNSWKPWTQSLT